MRGALAPFELLIDGPVAVVAHQDRGAVPVERPGHAVMGDQLAEQGGVAVQILLRARDQGQHPAGGIVDGPDQGARGLGPDELGIAPARSDRGAAAARQG